jgi:GNAT superfamily N-acetyltransferase
MTVSAQPSITQRSEEVLTYRIRLARAEEVARLQAIEDETATLFSGLRLIDEALDMSFPLEELDRLIDIGQVWVACLDDDSPVGMVIAAVREGAVYIEEMDVLPAYSGRGLGTRLLATVCAWAQAAGYPTVTLSTFRDVPWNGPFYRKHGFRDLRPSEWTPSLRAIREHEAQHGPLIEARVFMRRELRVVGTPEAPPPHWPEHLPVGALRVTRWSSRYKRRSGSTTTSSGSLS